jgi:hypothetical protein
VEKKLEVEVDDRRRMEEVLSANNLTNMASLYREEGEVSKKNKTKHKITYKYRVYTRPGKVMESEYWPKSHGKW